MRISHEAGTGAFGLVIDGKKEMIDAPMVKQVCLQTSVTALRATDGALCFTNRPKRSYISLDYAKLRYRMYPKNKNYKNK